MKQILVISDVHGSAENLEHLLKKEKYSDIIFCGDGIKEVMESSILSSAKRFFVRGNTDKYLYDNIEFNLTCGIYNRLFFITHGNEFGVKDGNERLLMFSKENYIDVAIFGHTHYPLYIEENGIILFNPGSLSSGSYGMIDCNKPEFVFYHKRL